MTKKRSAFAELIRQVRHPDSVDINAGWLKVTFSESLKRAVADLLGRLRGKSVLFASTNNELWYLVFPSLREIRNEFADAYSVLLVTGPSDLAKTVEFMLDLVASYLSEHETDYIRFIGSKGLGYSDAPGEWSTRWAHPEREWPGLGQASRDLLDMRKTLQTGIMALNAFVSKDQVLVWEDPNPDFAFQWSEFAARRDSRSQGEHA
jgi:hypothetical protein